MPGIIRGPPSQGPGHYVPFPGVLRADADQSSTKATGSQVSATASTSKSDDSSTRSDAEKKELIAAIQAHKEKMSVQKTVQDLMSSLTAEQKSAFVKHIMREMMDQQHDDRESSDPKPSLRVNDDMLMSFAKDNLSLIKGGTDNTSILEDLKNGKVYKSTQIVRNQRHFQGNHNIGKQWTDLSGKIANTDATGTERGELQAICSALEYDWGVSQGTIKLPDNQFTSPLHRCIETGKTIRQVYSDRDHKPVQSLMELLRERHHHAECASDPDEERLKLRMKDGWSYLQSEDSKASGRLDSFIGHKGETDAQFFDRCKDAVMDITQLGAYQSMMSGKQEIITELQTHAEIAHGMMAFLQGIGYNDCNKDNSYFNCDMSEVKIHTETRMDENGKLITTIVPVDDKGTLAEIAPDKIVRPNEKLVSKLLTQSGRSKVYSSVLKALLDYQRKTGIKIDEKTDLSAVFMNNGTTRSGMSDLNSFLANDTMRPGMSSTQDSLAPTSGWNSTATALPMIALTA